MKTKEQKYQEAAERNLKLAAKTRYHLMSLAEAKMKLGIRTDDVQYNNRVITLTKTGC